MHETNRNYHNPNPLVLTRDLLPEDLQLEPKVSADWRVWEINVPQHLEPRTPLKPYETNATNQKVKGRHAWSTTRCDNTPVGAGQAHAGSAPNEDLPDRWRILLHDS